MRLASAMAQMPPECLEVFSSTDAHRASVPFPLAGTGNPSYSQTTPANARVQGLPMQTTGKIINGTSKGAASRLVSAR